MQTQNNLINLAPLGASLNSPIDQIPQIQTNEIETIDRVNQASTALQAHIRRNNVQKLIVWPSELKAAWWGSIASITKESWAKQKEFSIFMSRMVSKTLADPSSYGKEQYFPKAKNGVSQCRETTSPLCTFYITVADDLTTVTIAINEQKKVAGLLGYGTNRIVSKGQEMQVPLTIDKQRRLIQLSGAAVSRSRTKDPYDFAFFLAHPNQFQQDLYDKLKNENLPGRIASASRIRQHLKNGSITEELVGPRYLGDLSRLKVNGEFNYIDGLRFLKYEEKLSLIIDIFETIASLHEIGVVHRDIRPHNILVGDENSILHAYLHDFDHYHLGEYCPIAMSYDYFFWDMGGQIGLVSHASDIVGALFTACRILFFCRESYDQSLSHWVFKDEESWVLNQFIKLKEPLKDVGINLPYNLTLEQMVDSLTEITMGSDSKDVKQKAAKILAQTKADIKILQAFHKVFSKEEAWKNQLWGSCICYFANLTADEYKTLRKNDTQQIQLKYEEGVRDWQEGELMKMVTDDILNLLPEEYSQKPASEIFEALSKIPNDKYFSLPLKTTKQIQRFGSQKKSLLGELLPKGNFPLEADPALFSLLCSDDPQKRKEGREIGFQFFGRAGDLKQEIQQSREAYLNELKKWL